MSITQDRISLITKTPDAENLIVYMARVSNPKSQREEKDQEGAGRRKGEPEEGRPAAEGAAGAEGACQETDEEHWQRHSCQLGAHLCCRCNFIKRRMEIKRDLPWCSPRPRFMGIGALVATLVLGWLPTAARGGTKSGAGAINATVQGDTYAGSGAFGRRARVGDPAKATQPATDWEKQKMLEMMKQSW